MTGISRTSTMQEANEVLLATVGSLEEERDVDRVTVMLLSLLLAWLLLPPLLKKVRKLLPFSHDEDKVSVTFVSSASTIVSPFRTGSGVTGNTMRSFAASAERLCNSAVLVMSDWEC